MSAVQTSPQVNGRTHAELVGKEVAESERPQQQYWWIAGFVLLVGVMLAVLVDGSAPFTPGSDFMLLAGFYIAAQAIERMFELLALSPIPPNPGTTARADKTVFFAALSFLAGVGLSLGFGLYFLHAVGVGSTSRFADVIVTALLISGGTKTLHELIGRITAAKEAAQAQLLR